MNKKPLIILFLIVFFGMFFTHPYVIYVAGGWVAEFLEIFDSEDECIKVTNNEPALDLVQFLTCDRTNVVALVSALIDVRSESVVRGLDAEVKRVKHDPHLVNNHLSYNALKTRLFVQRLDPGVIRYRVAELLSPSRDVRDHAIGKVLKDIESTFDPSYGTGLRSFTRWGVTIERMYPIYANPLVDDPPLSPDQQVFLAIVTSHYKAILYEEVEKCLIKQAVSSGNQYKEEIEALEKMWVQESAGNEN
jgi:hypothetical protein